MDFVKRELDIKEQIENLENIIEELEKMREEKIKQRSQEYDNLFIFPVDKTYFIHCFKRNLTMSSLTKEIEETERMIAIQKDSLNKYQEYLINNQEHAIKNIE